ncbi:hypothetical protein ACFOFO_05785 [Undibacterium arcticum]|uniref:Uncharacterized protein n=2 Tax=Undibacterium arcticum TaxID=1762892 RepID=A0ABV7EZY3_9BURK
MTHTHLITSGREGGIDLDPGPKIVAINFRLMSNTRVLNEVADLSAGNTAIDASTADLLTISGAANTATFVVASGMGEVINSAHEFKDRIDISTTAGGFGSEFSTPSSILFRSLMQKKAMVQPRERDFIDHTVSDFDPLLLDTVDEHAADLTAIGRAIDKGSDLRLPRCSCNDGSVPDHSAWEYSTGRHIWPATHRVTSGSTDL